MYVIMNDEGLYWYDFVCGCHVWKTITRASLFKKDQANDLIKDYGLVGCKVVLWVN